MLKSVVVCVALCHGLIGCGPFAGKDAESTKQDNVAEPKLGTEKDAPQSAAPAAVPVDAKEASRFLGLIAGTWHGECKTVPSERVGSVQSNFTYDKESVLAEQTEFRDDECKEPILSASYRGKLDVAEKSAKGDDAYAIEITFDSLHMRPRVQEEVDSLNKDGLCGPKAWQLNVAREITGKETNCDIEKPSDEFQQIIVPGEKALKIYRYESSDDYMVFSK